MSERVTRYTLCGSSVVLSIVLLSVLMVMLGGTKDPLSWDMYHILYGRPATGKPQPLVVTLCILGNAAVIYGFLRLLTPIKALSPGLFVGIVLLAVCTIPVSTFIFCYVIAVVAKGGLMVLFI